MGCWCTDNYFISGTMEWDFNSFDASIWLCSPPTLKNKGESNAIEPNKGENEAEEQVKLQQHNLELRSSIDNEKSNMECDGNQPLSTLTHEPVNLEVVCQNSLPKRESSRPISTDNDHVVVSWYKKQLLKFRNLQVNKRSLIFSK